MISETTTVLDREQLREVTFEDEDLMRVLVAALIEDTEKQIPLFHRAIETSDGAECARLAHYCKGACSNVGAKATASVLQKLERSGVAGLMDDCGQQLRVLGIELERLRAEKL